VKDRQHTRAGFACINMSRLLEGDHVSLDTGESVYRRVRWLDACTDCAPACWWLIYASHSVTHWSGYRVRVVDTLHQPLSLG
jgi:hypothetical protein